MKILFDVAKRIAVGIKSCMAIEHGGGGIQSEWSEGVAHPLTDPFKTLNQKHNDHCYSMDEMSMALNQVVGWVCHDGNFQRRGVFNRAMTLGFLMQSPELNLKTQTDLAKKLNLSRSQTNAIVRDFTDKFDFGTTTQRVRRGAKK